jgi:hypothetical protein
MTTALCTLGCGHVHSALLRRELKKRLTYEQGDDVYLQQNKKGQQGLELCAHDHSTVYMTTALCTPITLCTPIPDGSRVVTRLVQIHFLVKEYTRLRDTERRER